MAVHSEDASATPSDINKEGPAGTKVEIVHTNERVPHHPGYYEKGGLRTYGDDQDHDHEPKVWRDRTSFEPLKLCKTAQLTNHCIDVVS